MCDLQVDLKTKVPFGDLVLYPNCTFIGDMVTLITSVTIQKMQDFTQFITMWSRLIHDNILR